MRNLYIQVMRQVDQRIFRQVKATVARNWREFVYEEIIDQIRIKTVADWLIVEDQVYEV